MGQLFGTDGVRGIPGKYPLVPELVRKLGFVSAALLREQLLKAPPAGSWASRARKPYTNGHPPVVLMGRDSRDSGIALGKALVHGFSKAGCLTIDLGVVPTPAISYLTPRMNALCGVVISASHNPAEFNGIKFFTSDGFKMPPELEDEIERRMTPTADPGASVSTLDGRKAEPEDVGRYLAFLRSTFPSQSDLKGMRIVVDCANGAAAKFAPDLLRGLGAEVFAIGTKPDGKNINKGFGALETGAMQKEVVRRKAHCGVSLDGDADRAIFADEKGRLCDGDVIIGMSAVDMHEQGQLLGNKVVLTVMSNCGLIEYLRQKGIDTVCVPVGDRNVTEAIENGGLSLGGENSGHIVFRRFSPTGDGMLTALQTLSVLARSGKPLSSYRSMYKNYPQILTNVRIERKVPLDQLPKTRAAIKHAETKLHGRGRVLVRYSGTEPLVRVLVEGPDEAACRSLSKSIIDTFQREVRTPVAPVSDYQTSRSGD
ncbi:MAG: phosphoglucosamine mutase [Elusimicrobia bacterium]|nr:phosphoglucosamine mutase [Elusimicrobiota bacterium]